MNGLDLRQWLAEAHKLGELKDVRGADWNLELGAISELNVRKDAPPALLFDEIKGYPKGYRVLTCSTSSPARLSSILRLPIQKAHKALVEALRGKPAQWQAAAKNFPFAAASSGAVLQNVQKDASVDVLAFPSPLWHELDGGRYIGTGCSVVTRDLGSDWINVGTYRVQVIDKSHVALDMVPGKHGRIHYDKHKAAGKRFPVAIVCGSDPLAYLISGIEVPFGMCEYDYMGAILGQPVSVSELARGGEVGQEREAGLAGLLDEDADRGLAARLGRDGLLAGGDQEHLEPVDVALGDAVGRVEREGGLVVLARGAELTELPERLGQPVLGLRVGPELEQPAVRRGGLGPLGGRRLGDRLVGQLPLLAVQVDGALGAVVSTSGKVTRRSSFRGAAGFGAGRVVWGARSRGAAGRTCFLAPSGRRVKRCGARTVSRAAAGSRRRRRSRGRPARDLADPAPVAPARGVVPMNASHR